VVAAELFDELSPDDEDELPAGSDEPDDPLDEDESDDDESPDPADELADDADPDDDRLSFL